MPLGAASSLGSHIYLQEFKREVLAVKAVADTSSSWFFFYIFFINMAEQEQDVSTFVRVHLKLILLCPLSTTNPHTDTHLHT